MTLFILTTIMTFITMEGVTWCVHKYVMHGFLWYLHADHHQPKYQAIFEKNDFFFVMLSLPSIILFYFGIRPVLNILFFIGLGVLLYGIAYFLIHDVLIHQRFKWFKNTKNRYLLSLRRAHKVHHKKLDKHHGECFGMLWVPFKYYKKSNI